MSYLFSFAARSLQSFVLEGDQLKTMTGATELIDRLCRKSFLEKLLENAGVAGEIRQGAAGSARIVIPSKEDAERLARVWPVFCHCWAPGLEITQSLQVIENDHLTAAILAAEDDMRLARNFLHPALPLATPVMERCRRTGRAAAGVDKTDDNTPVDASTLRKLQMRDVLRDASEPSELLKIFGFENMDQVPASFDAIAGSERSYLAVIHADGNGLGQIFMRLSEEAAKLSGPAGVQETFEAVSRQVVEQSTKKAVTRVMAALELPSGLKSRPLLPIVLAGDDLTLVCRADLAWDFATEFLRAFNEESALALKAIKDDTKLPEPLRKCLPESLTSGAGISFVSGHYPFSLAYALSESLAGEAKKQAKKLAKTANRGSAPSSIHFFRVSGASAPDDYESLKEQHLKGDEVLLTAGPYYLEEGLSPNILDLEELADCIRKFPSGSIRQLINLLATDIGAVAPAYQRMLEIAGTRKSDEIDSVKRQLGLNDSFTGLFHGKDASPLPDALMLRLMGRKPGKKNKTAAASEATALS